MFAIVIESKVYPAFAVAVLPMNALFVAWVLAGTLLTQLRPILRRLHYRFSSLGHLRGSSSRSVPINQPRELARKPGLGFSLTKVDFCFITWMRWSIRTFRARCSR